MADNNAYAGSSVIPALLGPDGQPLRYLEPGERGNSLMDSYESYISAQFQLPPFNPDVWIASRGYRTLDEMMGMASVRASLDLIRDGVLSQGYRVVPAVNDKADANYDDAKMFAEALEYCLANIVDAPGNVYSFRDVLWEMLYAIHTGFSVAEINWRTLTDGPWAGKWGFELFAPKACKQVGFDVDPRTMAVRHVTSYTPLTGYTFHIPVEKVVRYTFAPYANLPYGQGIGRAVYKHYWSLDFLYRFWNIALETFGSPFILAKSELDILPKVRAIVQQIRQGAPAVLPKNAEAELVEIAGTGLAGFKSAAEHHIQQIALGYLRNTLTSGEGQRGGSRALGQVHQNTQEYGLGGRRTDMEQIANGQIARRWMRYNFGAPSLSLCPTISLGHWEERDMERLSAGFSTLVDKAIMHPGEPQIRERMNLEPLDPELLAEMKERWERLDAPTTPTLPSPADDPDPEDPDPDTSGDDSE